MFWILAGWLVNSRTVLWRMEIPASGKIVARPFLLAQVWQAEMLGQGGRQEQPDIGYQAVIVEGDADAVGVVAW